MKTNMIAGFPVLAGLCMLGLVACNAGKEKEEALKEIAALETKMHADSLRAPDRALIKELSQKYAGFAEHFSSDDKAPEFLYRAGEIASSLMNSGEAIAYFKEVCEKYPDHEKAPVCLFLQGFVYETQLKDIQKAKGIYEEFLKKYPKHDLADDVQATIQNLGKSDEELIRMFEEKNKPKVN